MRNFARLIGIWIILAHLQLSTAPRLYKASESAKRYMEEYINPFISKSYKFASYNGSPPGKIMRVWWIKYVCNDLYRVMIWFSFFAVCMKFSFLLARVGFIFFVYTLVDHFLLWYNYRTSSWHYLLLDAFMVIAFISLFLPEKRGAKVVSME